VKGLWTKETGNEHGILALCGLLLGLAFLAVS
jgi:hypothetical protein